MSSAIEHVAVQVEDLERTIKFLRDAFGLVVDRRAELPERRLRAAFLSWGAAGVEVLEVAGASPPTVPGAINHLAVAVDDLDEALSRLARLGIEAETDHPILVGGRRTVYLKPTPTWPARTQLLKHEPPPRLAHSQ